MNDANDDVTAYYAAYENLSGTFSAATPYLITVNENAGATDVELYLDGTSLTVSSNTYESMSNLGFRIGDDYDTFSGPTSGDSQRGSGSYWFNGDIAEVIVYSARASDADREQIETYLGIKYGIHT